MISLLDSLYPGDEVTFLAVNVLIQITAVTLQTMLFVRRVPRHAAVVRHAAWLFGIDRRSISIVRRGASAP